MTTTDNITPFPSKLQSAQRPADRHDLDLLIARWASEQATIRRLAEEDRTAPMARRASIQLEMETTFQHLAELERNIADAPTEVPAQILSKITIAAHCAQSLLPAGEALAAQDVWPLILSALDDLREYAGATA